MNYDYYEKKKKIWKKEREELWRLRRKKGTSRVTRTVDVLLIGGHCEYTDWAAPTAHHLFISLLLWYSNKTRAVFFFFFVFFVVFRRTLQLNSNGIFMIASELFMSDVVWWYNLLLSSSCLALIFFFFGKFHWFAALLARRWLMTPCWPRNFSQLDVTACMEFYLVWPRRSYRLARPKQTNVSLFIIHSETAHVCCSRWSNTIIMAINTTTITAIQARSPPLACGILCASIIYYFYH